MIKITITEALAEVKLITQKIESKTSFISEHVAWSSKLKDPLESSGGSTVIISQELQAIRDLSERLVLLRGKITESNMTTFLTLGKVNRCISDWLIWRREVAPLLNKLYLSMSNSAKTVAARSFSKSEATEDVSMSISWKDLSDWSQALQIILGELDGKLSLLNARTEIEL